MLQVASAGQCGEEEFKSLALVGMTRSQGMLLVLPMGTLSDEEGAMARQSNFPSHHLKISVPAAMSEETF